jgi:hypothetical protein
MSFTWNTRNTARIRFLGKGFRLGRWLCCYFPPGAHRSFSGEDKKDVDEEDPETLLFWLRTAVDLIPCGASVPWWNPSAVAGAGGLKVGREELVCGVVGSEPPLLASFYPWSWRSGAGPMPLEALLPSECEEVSSFWSLTWVFCIRVPGSWRNGAWAHPTYNCEQDDVKIL